MVCTFPFCQWLNYAPTSPPLKDEDEVLTLSASEYDLI